MRKGISCASDATARANVNSAIPQKEATASATDICSAGCVIRQDMQSAEPTIRETGLPSDATEADICPTEPSVSYVTAKADIPATFAAEQEYSSVNAGSRDSPANVSSASEPDGDSSIHREYVITPHPCTLPTARP